MTPNTMRPANEAILELLQENTKLTTRQITDLLTARGHRWSPQNPVPTSDRVHNRLIAMLLRGQVKRKKSAGVWVWSLP